MSASIPNHESVSQLERDCLDALEKRGSKIQSLHPHQLTAIHELLSGNSVFQRVQTGGGKTLVVILLVLLRQDYPNKYRSGKILAFFPTLALIQDTKRRLSDYGISCWTSPSNENSYTNGLSRASSCVISEPDEKTSSNISQVDVVLSTGEFWASSSPKAQAARNVVAREENRIIWIDEADTAVITSKTYRPSQSMLGDMPGVYAPAPVLFSSATFTEILLKEAVMFYKSKHAKFVQTQADRQNLKVKRLDAADMKAAKGVVYEQIEDLLCFVAHSPNERTDQAIIFVRSHKDVDDMCAYLKGLSPTKLIDRYHAEMLSKEKKILKNFASLKTRVLVVTLASFAAGMDYPNVRSVYLLNIPESVEQFWQAIGRAGRDGKPASVYLFASLTDTAKALAESQPSSHYAIRIVLRAFGVSSRCRLKETLEYIDGINSTTSCGHCDLCEGFSSHDAHKRVHSLLNSVQYPEQPQRTLDLAVREFDEDTIRASLEMGTLCVHFDQHIQNKKKLILSVSTDDAAQQRLRESCVEPLWIYLAKGGAPRGESTEPKKRQKRGHT